MRNHVAIFAKRSIADIWQCSEYASSPQCTRVINIPFPKYNKNVFKESSISWKLGGFFEKI